MIKKFYSNKNRAGWRFDSRLKKYFSWGFDIRLADNRRKREPGFVNRADAESAVAKIRQLEKDSKYGFSLPAEAPTLREVCDQKILQTTNPKEQVRSTRVLQILCEVTDVDRVTELETIHLRKFAERRKRDGLNSESVNRELNIVSAALHSAPMNFPALAKWSCPKIPRPRRVKRRRERVITAEELTKVLTWLYRPREAAESVYGAANRRNVAHVLHAACLTGARKGELCKMRWDYVDWGARAVQIVGTKNAYTSDRPIRPLEIDEALGAILLQRRAVSQGDYVFTRNGGEVTHYYKILKAACQAVGVPYGQGVVGGFVTHDARHTAVTRMLQAGVDLATIGSITGHADPTMILRYGHASNQSKRTALNVLERFAGLDSLDLKWTQENAEEENLSKPNESGSAGRTRAA